MKKTEKEILAQLEKIRTSGSLQDLEQIFEILRTHPEGNIGKASQALIADIKDPKVVEVLIAALKDKSNFSIRKALLQSCWESGLDYSRHLAFLVDLFLSLDYLGALEAFTLIENTLLDQDVDAITRKELITKTKSVIIDLPEHNKNLGLELILLLEEPI